VDVTRTDAAAFVPAAVVGLLGALAFGIIFNARPVIN
jgi:hypothetical protein